MKNRVFMVYIIGISGSGKTTIATRLTKELKNKGTTNLQLIDGDVIREELGGIFGYTFDERMKNNKAVCVVASYLVRNGISVILTQVGGYEKMRQQVRSMFPDAYVEVYVKCSVEECARRDVKGYYNKAKSGKMKNLNGLNDTYEVPKHSDVVVDTEYMSVEEGVDRIIACLEERGYV